MDFLEFLQKSEWPLLVGGAIFLFKKELAELIRDFRIKKVSGPGWNIETESRLQIGQHGLNSVEALPRPNSERSSEDGTASAPNVPAQSLQLELEPSDTPFDTEWYTLPRSTPRTRTLVAYNVLALYISNLFREVRGLSPDEPVAAPLVSMASAVGLRPPETGALVELEMIFRDAKRDPNFVMSEGEANRFVAITKQLYLRIRSLHQGLPS